MVKFNNSSTSIVLITLTLGWKDTIPFNPVITLNGKEMYLVLQSSRWLSMRTEWERWENEIAPDGDYYIHGARDVVCINFELFERTSNNK